MFFSIEMIFPKTFEWYVRLAPIATSDRLPHVFGSTGTEPCVLK